MFDKERDTVNIFLYESVIYYPPTISLIQCLLHNGYRVHLVAQQCEKLDLEIKGNTHFSFREVKKYSGNSPVSRLQSRTAIQKVLREELKKTGKSDIIWTVNPLAVRTLGKDLLAYGDRHIMQLLELTNDLPLYRGSKYLRFDLSKYGRNAAKVVVAEINRAYIQRVEWGLKKLPYVIPNKPYVYPEPLESEDVTVALEKMKKETRKIIVYLGVLDPDREFAAFARAIETVKDEYCLYLFGKCSPTEQPGFQALCQQYSCINYMGFFNPPKHLSFLQHAYIALTPYMPGVVGRGFEKLNALYCAPNKIYEYAGSNLPMIGTDVLGLKEAFDKYNIGICCADLEPETIVSAIRYVDEHHAEMTKNCSAFYDAVNLDDIILKIIDFR